MPGKSTDILAEIVELVKRLPEDPSEYGRLSVKKRRTLRSELGEAISQLNLVSQTLDTVHQPKHVLDPTDPKVIGRMVADALLLQPKESLVEITEHKFYGAGVYALYYRGNFGAYGPVSGLDHPLYVGKADPAALHAHTAEAQGTRLHSRLKDHYRSILRAENLRLEDFDCRYLVVRSAWVETAEDLLIEWFKPVWNNEMKVCYGFGKHGDLATTRRNERSPWDTLHPGRPWAKAKGNTPNKKSVSQIRVDIGKHFKANPLGR